MDGPNGALNRVASGKSFVSSSTRRNHFFEFLSTLTSILTFQHKMDHVERVGVFTVSLGRFSIALYCASVSGRFPPLPY
jgi:hypothetical protein